MGAAIHVPRSTADHEGCISLPVRNEVRASPLGEPDLHGGKKFKQSKLPFLFNQTVIRALGGLFPGPEMDSPHPCSCDRGGHFLVVLLSGVRDLMAQMVHLLLGMEIGLRNQSARRVLPITASWVTQKSVLSKSKDSTVGNS